LINVGTNLHDPETISLKYFKELKNVQTKGAEIKKQAIIRTK